MDTLLKKKAVYRVDPPPDTIDGWQRKLTNDKVAWGRYFRNDEEAELFCMLPISNTQRHVILRALESERAFKREVDECNGKVDASPEHRAACVSCVMKQRPGCATAVQ